MKTRGIIFNPTRENIKIRRLVVDVERIFYRVFWHSVPYHGVQPKLPILLGPAVAFDYQSRWGSLGTSFVTFHMTSILN